MIFWAWFWIAFGFVCQLTKQSEIASSMCFVIANVYIVGSRLEKRS